MLLIRKGKEPESWTQAKRELAETPDATVNYRNVKDKVAKEKLLEALLEEQGHRCAYCMRLIGVHSNEDAADTLDAHVEHYVPQNPTDALRESMGEGGHFDADELSIDYGNLLAVCSGGEEGGHGRVRCCDKSRSDTKMLSVNPLDETSVSRVAYLRDGTITSDDDDIKRDLDEQLNLNDDEFSFKTNRKELIESIDQWVAGLEGSRSERVDRCVARRREFLNQQSGASRESYLGTKLWRLQFWIDRWQ